MIREKLIDQLFSFMNHKDRPAYAIQNTSDIASKHSHFRCDLTTCHDDQVIVCAFRFIYDFVYRLTSSCGIFYIGNPPSFDSLTLWSSIRLAASSKVLFKSSLAPLRPASGRMNVKRAQITLPNKAHASMHGQTFLSHHAVQVSSYMVLEYAFFPHIK